MYYTSLTVKLFVLLFFCKLCSTLYFTHTLHTTLTTQLNYIYNTLTHYSILHKILHKQISQKYLLPNKIYPLTNSTSGMPLNISYFYYFCCGRYGTHTVGYIKVRKEDFKTRAHISRNILIICHL